MKEIQDFLRENLIFDKEGKLDLDDVIEPLRESLDLSWLNSGQYSGFLGPVLKTILIESRRAEDENEEPYSRTPSKRYYKGRMRTEEERRRATTAPSAAVQGGARQQSATAQVPGGQAPINPVLHQTFNNQLNQFNQFNQVIINHSSNDQAIRIKELEAELAGVRLNQTCDQCNEGERVLNETLGEPIGTFGVLSNEAFDKLPNIVIESESELDERPLSIDETHIDDASGAIDSDQPIVKRLRLNQQSVDGDAPAAIYAVQLPNAAFSNPPMRIFKDYAEVDQQFRGETKLSEIILLQNGRTCCGLVPPLNQMKNSSELIGLLRSKNAVDVSWIELTSTRPNGEACIISSARAFIEKYEHPEQQTAGQSPRSICSRMTNCQLMKQSLQPPRWVKNWSLAHRCEQNGIDYVQLAQAGWSANWRLPPGGASQYFVLLFGSLQIWLTKADESAMQAYEGWLDAHREPLPNLLPSSNSIYSIELTSGQALLLPTGWLYAMNSQSDSALLGGLFLQTTDLAFQINAHGLDCKRASNRSLFTSCFPHFELIMVLSYMIVIRDRAADFRRVNSRIGEAEQKPIRELAVWTAFCRKIWNAWSADAKYTEYIKIVTRLFKTPALMFEKCDDMFAEAVRKFDFV